MKHNIIITALLMLITPLIAQEEETDTSYWTKGAVTTISFSQVAQRNWAAGGESSISGVGFFNAFINYKKDIHTWDNTLNLGYGIMKQDGDDWFKNDDKLEFSSKYGRQATKDLYYSGLIDFKSQFSKGYASVDDVDHVSSFLAPAYINIALGMDYKPSDNFTIFISPLTGKMTLVTDSELSVQGAYGVEAGKQFRSEFGAFFKVEYKTEILKNVDYETKLDLFSNYAHNPQNIDVNWDNLFTFKVNEYLNATLMFNLVFDDDILFAEDRDNDGIDETMTTKLQWKEMFGLGISYKL